MITSDDGFAVRCVGVRKSYPLYNSLLEMALDRFGFGALARLRRGGPIRMFEALRGIDLSVRRGERVGLIGRNGAGKSTLLKLFTGNYQPSSGRVEVDGKVQTLMNTGLGFHLEFTGYENLRSALQYNDLTKDEHEQALADAIEFVELDDFLYQPVTTYSLGMKMRLQFAAATAIKPEILIIDEVLGAGDAYFAGKSARRVKALTGSGCTLLLVSHSMQQILQFCERAVWLEAGEIVMEGETLPVVRAYEEFARRLDHEAETIGAQGKAGSALADERLRAHLLARVREGAAMDDGGAAELDTTNVSRWPGKDGMRITKLRLRDSSGITTRTIRAGEPAAFEIDFEHALPAGAQARFAIVVYREDGFVATRLISDYTEVAAGQQSATIRVELPETQFGAGNYMISASVYEKLDLDASSNAVVYDLLSRCFKFSVLGLHADDPSLFHVRQSWSIPNATR